jgi:hypothetical protein
MARDGFVIFHDPSFVFHFLSNEGVFHRLLLTFQRGLNGPEGVLEI